VDRLRHEIRFGVRGRISIRKNGVLCRRHDLAIEHEKGTEGMVASRPRLTSQLDSLSDKPFVMVAHQSLADVQRVPLVQNIS
jgi:hypothetical protein